MSVAVILIEPLLPWGMWAIYKDGRDTLKSGDARDGVRLGVHLGSGSYAQYGNMEGLS
jgi:hypothetical protein